MWNDDNLCMASKRRQSQINKQSKIQKTNVETHIHESPVSSSEKRAKKIFGERRRISSSQIEIEKHPLKESRRKSLRLQAKQPTDKLLYDEQNSESSEDEHTQQKFAKKMKHRFTSSFVESDQEHDPKTFVAETQTNIPQNSQENDCVIKYECTICHAYFTTDYSKRKHRNTKHKLFQGKQLFLKKLLPMPIQNLPNNDASVSTSTRSTNYLNNRPCTTSPCRSSTVTSDSDEEDCDDQDLNLPKDNNIKQKTGYVFQYSATTDLTSVPDNEKVQGKKVLPLTIKVFKSPVHPLENEKQLETSRKRKAERHRSTYQEKPNVTNVKIQRRRTTMTTSIPESIEEPINKICNKENPNAAVKYTLFKCLNCLNHFVSFDTFSEHLKSCTKDVPPNSCSKTCKGCGFNFMECELEKHAQNRPPCSSIEQFEIMKIEVQNIVNRKIYKEKKATLFRCGICKRHFTKCYNVKLHLLNGEHSLENSRECPKCGFSFIEDFEYHYEEHHKQLNLSREDFFVQNFDENWASSNEHEMKNHEYSEKNIRNGDEKEERKNQEYGSRDKRTGNEYQRRTCNYSDNISQVINGIRDVQDATTSKREKPKLYQCLKCSVHFLTCNALKKHITMDLHNATVKVQCNECDLWFCSDNLLYKHKKLHHSQIDLSSPTDFDISCYINNNTQNQLVCVPLLREHTNNDTTKENIGLDSAITIYKCKYCGIHYTLERSIINHIKNHELKKDYNVNTKICRICDLKFTIASLDDHNQEVHYKGSAVTPENFVFIEYPLNNSVEVVHSDEQSEYENRTSKDNFMDKYDNNANYVAEKDRKGVNVNNYKEKCDFKLYKCSSCNVHFTEMSACEDHVKKHKDSHNFKYKKCGCGLRFDKAEFIKHRMKHHARNFNLRDVVIIEIRSTAMNETS